MTVELDDLLADLRTLVEVESPSLELPAVEASAAAVAALIERRLGLGRRSWSPAPPGRTSTGAGAASRGCCSSATTTPCSRRRAGGPAVHRRRRAGRPGPGVFDMKGGHRARRPRRRRRWPTATGVELLVTRDEEVGSGASRALIEERAPACGAVLVLEPAADGGAVKIGRKGTGGFEVVVHGRAAHAGLEPEKGVNALVEAARQVLAIVELGRPERRARP